MECTQCHRFVIGATNAGPGLCMDCLMMARGQAQVNYDALHLYNMSRLAQAGMTGTVASLPQGAAAQWRERAERAEAELHRLRVQTANLEAQLNQATFELMYRVPEKVNGSLSQAMLTKILSLVHPDKHGNSEVSNEVTKYILSLRRK